MSKAETVSTRRLESAEPHEAWPVSAGPASTRAWLPFVAVGALLVLAGGLVSAAGGEDPSRHLSWASAYLVLVCGLAQVFLGGGQALLAPAPPHRGLLVGEVAVLNLANAAVIVGTLAGVAAALWAGSALFLVALSLFAWVTREAVLRYRPGLVAYRVVLVVLAASVPVGSVLGH
ncbi:MAG: hypothetical protein ACRDZX_06140 [Acidimicrobiales bacterium]